MTSSPALSAVRIVTERQEWDEHVSVAPSGHLLQSYAWGEFKARYGWQVERYLATAADGVAAAQVMWRATPLGAIGYVPRGPAISEGAIEAAGRLVQGISEQARSRGAIFLSAEPNQPDPSPLPRLGFRQGGETAQPRASLVIDLTLDLEELSRRQHPKTRYNINLAARKGVRVRLGDESDVSTFCRLMVETGQRNGFAVRPEAYYRDALACLGDSAELLVAEHEGDFLGGIMLARFNGDAIYLYGASSSVKRNLMPTQLLQWEAMRRAKEQGLQRYDLWGVPAELADSARPDGSDDGELPEARIGDETGLWGVYRFKRGFGGRLVAYSRAQDLVFNSRRYWLWQRAVPRVLALLRRRRVAEY